MPCKGFLCPLNAKNVNFDTCDICPSPCMELPILYALFDGARKVEPNRFSVTEILKPPQVLAMERLHDYWVDPESLVWATFGTSWHALIERQDRRLMARGVVGYTFEKTNHFEKPFKLADGREVIVHGTPDQYFWPTHTLTDYKTLKYYWDFYYLQKGDWASSSYGKQVNLYRYFAFPDCKHMQLVALIKDYNRKLRDKCGVHSIERVTVPFMPDAEIEAFLQERLLEHLTAQEDLAKVRECTAEERWKDNLRCYEYCPCGKFCHQFNQREASRGE